MTTAWYSNVAQTGSLIFNTSSWGFSGHIEVTNAAITASPGASGIVPFTIKNDSDSPVSVDVTVSKTSMEEGLKKRIYFYADTSLLKNGEQMSRVYIDSTEGYTYSLGVGENLSVSEDTYNDVPILWEWVYDMLGYYVQGKLNEGKTSVEVERYLRPIEYDYDTATFEKVDGKGGKLLTVDGEKTAEEFLKEISANDGYEGEIDTNTVYGGYYPVSVDKDGSGVWAYLCNYSEIETGIGFDTDFAKRSAEQRGFTATINFSAQNMSSTTAVADSAEELANAIKDEAVDIIKLKQNVELESALSLTAGDTAVIDLDGHTLSCTGNAVITAGENSSISLFNGTIKGDSELTGQEAVRSVGANVTLNGVKVSDMDFAVVVTDNKGNCDSTVKILNSEFTTKQTAVLLQGNGPASEEMSRLIVENSKINSDYIGISGQGSATGENQFWGTDIQVINSEVSGKWAGIYHPQQHGTMTVSSQSKISGYTGIAVKGGEVTVIDSEVKGTGASQEPAAAAGGWTDTGDGIYVEATYPWAANVVIKGECNVSSAKRKAVELYTVEGKGPGSIKIYGGTFSPDVSEYWVTEQTP